MSENLDRQYSITELVDIDQLRLLFEQFAEATGFTIGFLDHPGLNVLIATGWRDICTRFHRSCPAADEVCRASNHHLLDQLKEPGQIVIERCGHGLVDCATPIIINGRHLASLATGQMLLAPADPEQFRCQASRFGFDERAYMEALEKIPVISEEKLKSTTAFLGSMAHVISEIGYAHLLLREKTENLEQSIKRAEELAGKAEAATRAKSEFLGMMSHELRTPLNGVLGFTELLADTPLNDEQKSFTKTISSSGEHLLAIVNDILDFSSIEKGALAIRSEPFATSGLLDSAVIAASKDAVEKRLEFRCEVAAGVPEQIVGDERRIRQILINLLNNAVKFTSAGSVVFRVSPASAGDRHLLDFSVEDTGIGISSETLGHLFQPFVQADSTYHRPFGGTGLGLVISKRLAEAMGGTLTVVSAPGKGSTFTFRLPLEVSGPASSDPATAVPIEQEPIARPGNLVLVVDDDRDSRMLAGKMLQSLGCFAEDAADGAEAVKAFVPEKYLAILMDMAMPVMDGMEAARNIRALESGSHAPIIALTANVMRGDRERCLTAGMDDFLAKPFKRAELAAKLALIAQR